jgi:hypothetical protein
LIVNQAVRVPKAADRVTIESGDQGKTPGARHLLAEKHIGHVAARVMERAQLLHPWLAPCTLMSEHFQASANLSASIGSPSGWNSNDSTACVCAAGEAGSGLFSGTHKT